jgi:hypothetical protein
VTPITIIIWSLLNKQTNSSANNFILAILFSKSTQKWEKKKILIIYIVVVGCDWNFKVHFQKKKNFKITPLLAGLVNAFQRIEFYSVHKIWYNNTDSKPKIIKAHGSRRSVICKFVTANINIPDYQVINLHRDFLCQWLATQKVYWCSPQVILFTSAQPLLVAALLLLANCYRVEFTSADGDHPWALSNGEQQTHLSLLPFFSSTSLKR